MAECMTRRAVRSVIRGGLGLGALLLAGCSVYDTGGSFTTNQQVALRAWDTEDAPVTAVVPQGTPVERLGWVSGNSWLVNSPYGHGFVFTRYLDLHLADSQMEQ